MSGHTKGLPIAQIADPDDPRHGIYTGYRAHIRAGIEPCDRCRRANARYRNEGRMMDERGEARTVPSLGTSRRLQALMAIGYTCRRIGEPMGLDASNINMLMRNPPATVLPATAERVARGYEKLCMTPPPRVTSGDRRSVSLALSTAKKNGYAPPLAWDDIDTDETPAVVETDDMSAKERRDAGRLDRLEVMDAAGRNVTYAAEALGITREGLNHWCRERGHMDLYWRLVKRDPDAGDNQHLAA